MRNSVKRGIELVMAALQDAMNEAADDDIHADSDTDFDSSFSSDDDVSEVRYIFLILHKLL